MADELKYTIFDTNLGFIGILGSARGLLYATLPQRSTEEVRRLLGDRISHAAWSPPSFKDVIERLRAYLGGHEITFPDELDLSLATAFQRRVWEETRLIPYGETRSYSRLAEQTGRPAAARAVGQALARNPLPIIVPCHRVVAGNGKPGGYGGGLAMKKYLLRLEAPISISS
jgi:methylated-DNA-[protein]-cysteine S-methyltransferase